MSFQTKILSAGFIPALLLLFALFSQCDSRAGEKDLEKDRIYFLLLTLPDATTECQKSEEAALACSRGAGRTDAAYIAAVQAAWKVTVPSGASGQGPAEICRVLPESPNWSFGGATYADSGKLCHMRCNQEFHEIAGREGRCTSAGYPQLQNDLSLCGPFVWKTTCAVDQMKNCLNACLVQGTIL